MKAVMIQAFGHEDQLRIAELPDPVPGPSEVLIEIACTSVNPVDWKIRKGLLQGRMPHQFPIVLGWDAAGTIRSSGKQAKRFSPGEQVYAYCRKPLIQWGTYAEFVTVDESAVARMPSNISFAEAAALPLVSLTAWQCLHDIAHIQSGETALILAGSGGVGGMAIQFAKAAGARVITTTSERNRDYVKKLGADSVIDHHKESVRSAIERLAPGGVDLVLDTLGGAAQEEGFSVTKKGGRLVSIISPPDISVAAKHGVLGLYHFVNPCGSDLEKIATLIEIGKVRPPEIEELPLSQVAQAHLQSEEGHVRGKLVLKVR